LTLPLLPIISTKRLRHMSESGDAFVSSTEHPVDISLIICTRDRSQQLVRCLESVRRIVFERGWELIIVDNGSLDDTAAVVRKFIGSVTIPTSYVFEPIAGLGNAHNAGLKIARGEILAFTDDDCYPAPDFLSQTWTSFKDTSLGYITGRILLHDPTDYPITINHSTASLVFPAHSFIEPATVQGANMAFRASVLRDIGGFDPLFGPGALFNTEDLDAAARASALGWKGEYRPEVVVSHHHGRKTADIRPLWRSYHIGIGAYRMKLLLQRQRPFWSRPLYWKPRKKAIIWEATGATRYSLIHLGNILRSRFGRA
jgi:glycosyltransferase involved in cell wall biosynthesis